MARIVSLRRHLRGIPMVDLEMTKTPADISRQASAEAHTELGTTIAELREENTHLLAALEVAKGALERLEFVYKRFSRTSHSGPEHFTKEEKAECYLCRALAAIKAAEEGKICKT